MSLEVVGDSAKLPFRDMMVLDYRLVLLSSEQCSNDVLLLSLIERCVGHDQQGVKGSAVHSSLLQ